MACWGAGCLRAGKPFLPGSERSCRCRASPVPSCALKTDGTIVCWGDNGSGQTVVPNGLAEVAQVSAGFWHNCVVQTDEIVICWGHNGSGQSTVPASLNPSQTIVFVSTAPIALEGNSHTIAATGGGSGNPVVLSSNPGSLQRQRHIRHAARRRHLRNRGQPSCRKRIQRSGRSDTDVHSDAARPRREEST